jgi:hypothetical protein
MTDDNLSRIDVNSGVNYAGIGIVVITAISQSGDKFVGILTPDKTRELGWACFAEAETAEVNDILYSLMKEILDLDDDAISDFIRVFEQARKE